MPVPATFGGVHVVPAEIPGPPSDVTADLVAWLAGLDPGSVALLDGRTFRCEGTIESLNPQALQVDGQGATIMAIDPRTGQPNQRDRAHFRSVGGQGYSVHGVSIQGPYDHSGNDEDYEAQHAFDVQNTKDIDIYGNMVRNVWGDFVYLGRSRGDKTQSSGHVHGNDARWMGRTGVSFTCCADVIVDGKNRIAECGRSSFDFEPLLPSWVVDRVTVEDNDIGNARLLFVAAVSNKDGGPVRNVRVVGNRLTRTMQVSVAGQRLASGATNRSDFDISKNVTTDVWGTTGPASLMKFVNVDGTIMVAGNTSPMQAGRPKLYGASFYMCEGDLQAVYMNQFVRAQAAAWDRGGNGNVVSELNRIAVGGKFV